jgi:hypothetical protein
MHLLNQFEESSAYEIFAQAQPVEAALNKVNYEIDSLNIFWVLGIQLVVALVSGRF